MSESAEVYILSKVFTIAFQNRCHTLEAVACSVHLDRPSDGSSFIYVIGIGQVGRESELEVAVLIGVAEEAVVADVEGPSDL